MLLELHDVIIKPLIVCFNNSLQQKKIPESWTLAYVAPIHKKGDRKIVSIYRPVSLTSITCKLMEKLHISLIILKLITIFQNHSMVLLKEDQQQPNYWKLWINGQWQLIIIKELIAYI